MVVTPCLRKASVVFNAVSNSEMAPVSANDDIVRKVNDGPLSAREVDTNVVINMVDKGIVRPYPDPGNEYMALCHAAKIVGPVGSSDTHNACDP